MKKALITGIAGQDGSYLAEFLLDKNYEVYGLLRKDTSKQNIGHIINRVKLFFVDLNNNFNYESILKKIQPNEIYNLASQSRPSESWVRNVETLQLNSLSAINLFDSVRNICPEAKIYQSSSSEMFGNSQSLSLDENSLFNPQNPYAASKLLTYNMANIYRSRYNLFIANGVLFNHESERRPLHFISQKIAFGAACAVFGIKNSIQVNEFGAPLISNGKLKIGNLDSGRDWGYAQDFIRAMWLMLQSYSSENYVIGTGIFHTIQDLCDVAYQHVGMNWSDHIILDPEFSRSDDQFKIIANPSKARKNLNWEPAVKFEDMIIKMVEANIGLLKTTI